jgi:hypothetical protein
MATSDNFWISFHYDGQMTFREGAPISPMGMPLYPDPSLYSPDIIAGFEKWVELVKPVGKVDFEWVDPSEERFKKTPSVRIGDYRDSVKNLLGEFSWSEEFEDGNLIAEFYSESVMILYETKTQTVKGIYTHREPAENYTPWRFVFVNPNLRKLSGD